MSFTPCSCHEAGITERQAVSCFLAQQTLLSLVTELGKALCIPLKKKRQKILVTEVSRRYGEWIENIHVPYISWAYMDMAKFQSPTSTTFRCILLSE